MPKVENKMLAGNYVEWAIGDLYLYDEESGVEYASTTLSTADFTSSADREDVRGGTDNSILYSLPGEKEVTFEVHDVVSRIDWTALKNGETLKEVGSENLYCYHMPKYYGVTVTGTDAAFTLDEEPLEGEEVMIYLEDGTMIDTSAVNISGKAVTITVGGTGLASDKKVRVMGFKYKMGENALYYAISPEAKNVNLIGVYKKPVFNRKTHKVEYYKITYYPQVTLTSDYTESDTTTKEAVDETHTMTITKKDNETALGYVYYVPVA